MAKKTKSDTTSTKVAEINLNGLIEKFNEFLKETSYTEGFKDFLKDAKLVKRGLISKMTTDSIKVDVSYFDRVDFYENYSGKYESFVSFLDNLDIKSALDENATDDDANKEKSRIFAPIVRKEVETGKGLSYKNVEDFDNKYYLNLYFDESDLKKSKNQPFTIKKTHPKLNFFGKKIALPTVIVAAITGVVGAIFGAVGTVGATAGLTDNLLLNIATFGILGGASGLVATPAVILSKDALTKRHYKKKYGRSSQNTKILSSEAELKNVPVFKLNTLFNETNKKIKKYENSKNPFRKLQRYVLLKTNRNRLHELADTKYQLEEISNTIEDSTTKGRYKDVLDTLKSTLTSALPTKEYGDIVAAHWLGSPDDPTNKEEIKQAKKDQKDQNLRKQSYILKVIDLHKDLERDKFVEDGVTSLPPMPYSAEAPTKEDDETTKGTMPKFTTKPGAKKFVIDTMAKHEELKKLKEPVKSEESATPSPVVEVKPIEKTEPTKEEKPIKPADEKSEEKPTEEKKEKKSTDETRLEKIALIWEYKKHIGGLENIAHDLNTLVSKKMARVTPGKVASVTYTQNDVLTFCQQMTDYESKIKSMKNGDPTPKLSKPEQNMLDLIYFIAADYLKTKGITV